MMAIIFKNKIVLAAAALVIVGAIWYGFSSSSVPPDVLGTENAADALKEDDRDIVTKLLELNDVNLEGAILQSPIFLGLKDFNTEIMDEPKGRAEPFAPLPASAEISAESPAGSSGAAPASKSASAPASKPASKPASQPALPAGSNPGGSRPLFTPLD